MRETLAATMIIPVLLAGSSAWAQALSAPSGASRIAFVDIQRVLIRSQAGLAAREQLEREKAQMQREIDTRRQELDKLREDLDKKGSLLTAEARREKEEALERKRRDAARLADDFQRDLARKEQQLLVRVQQDLVVIIERLGKQKGYYMIVERRGAGVLYAVPDADLTDELIRVYDQESAGKGKK
ncbi:MAG TPA: OmpH family outer membrane protein [Gemmatimonadales bacterium]|nr:OmpH family outer membrane protein [Gemmatimonadales bacterium]